MQAKRNTDRTKAGLQEVQKYLALLRHKVKVQNAKPLSIRQRLRAKLKVQKRQTLLGYKARQGKA